jgi:glc operon protein GlcG
MSASRIYFTVLVFAAISQHAVAQEKTPPLVTRGRAELNLAGAEAILQAAQKKATAMGLKLNIAIVDDGGHLLLFARMDGARPASGYTALTKAVAAATFRQETGPLPAGGEPNLLLSLSLQSTAIAGGGKGTTLKGGAPILVDGQVVGAVGVGGGTGEQDLEVAKAGIAALIEGLRGK